MTGDGTDQHAVWSGRFQPVHVGHLAVLRHSLATLPMPHVAVLTAYFGQGPAGSSERPADGPAAGYDRAAEQAYDPARNPLTVWERFTLMRLALAGAGLTDQVAVLTAPRHDPDWATAALFYPPRRVICLTAKDAFESAKEALWRSRGERVHVFVDLNATNVLTTSMIRARVTAGADWRRYIPEQSHRYFLDIDGPDRVFGP